MLARLTFITLIGVLVSACASMSEDECRTADWYAVGYEDGTRGVSAEHFGERRKACAEHGVSPNLSAWLSGRDEGLKAYCTPQRGFQQGRTNTPYHGVCSAAAEVDFMTAYQDGLLVGEVERHVSDLQNQLYRAEDDLDETEKWLRRSGDIDAALVDDTLSEEERRDLLRQVRAYERQRGELEYEIRRLEAELAGARAELNHLRASLPY